LKIENNRLSIISIPSKSEKFEINQHNSISPNAALFRQKIPTENNPAMKLIILFTRIFSSPCKTKKISLAEAQRRQVFKTN